jgi:hypothetical protein
MVEKTQFEHITLFWQFVPSLSPRITGSPVRREGCSEPKTNLAVKHNVTISSEETYLVLYFGALKALYQIGRSDAA